MTAAIDVRGLEKSFGDVAVLRGVDFEVGPGTVFALLGANGAGKTTVVRILATLLAPDAGAVTVAGADELIDRSGSPMRRSGGSRHTRAACGAGSTSR